MKTKLSSALGLAFLAASLTFASSFACSNSGDEQTSVVNAPAAEVAQPFVAEVAQPLVAEAAQPSAAEVAQQSVAEVAQPSVAPVDQPFSVISESEPTAADESPPPAIYAVDAILVEVTQTVTIAAPGQSVAARINVPRMPNTTRSEVTSPKGSAGCLFRTVSKIARGQNTACWSPPHERRADGSR
jgi:hypothetical protein